MRARRRAQPRARPPTGSTSSRRSPPGCCCAGHRIDERPVTFTPRSRAAGKKIGWRDGIAAVRVLLRLRPRGAFADRARCLLLALTVAADRTLAVAAIGGFDLQRSGRCASARTVRSIPGIVAFVARRDRARTRPRPAARRVAVVVELRRTCRGADRRVPPRCSIVAVGWVWGTHVAGGSDSVLLPERGGAPRERTRAPAAAGCGDCAVARRGAGRSCPRAMRRRRHPPARSCRSARRDIR